MKISSPETACVVVGGGPAGAVLSFMLARQGLPVTLLEMHKDFERDFRGDTLHPSTLEIMDELGLAERLLQLSHTRLSQMTLPTESGPLTLADLGRLKTKFPFIALMPQARFLAFLTGEAKRFPNFQLVMGAMVDELVEDAEHGAIHGVRYRREGDNHEVRATLTVGADGRFSKLRKLSGLGEAAIRASPPMDVMWFRLPRKADDPHGLMGRIGAGHLLIQLDRGEEWQIAFIIRKGSYPQLRAAGLDELHREIVVTAPELADRVGLLADWKQIALLSVAADRLPRWYRSGLLLIGDAAHVMSPAGGNGINYAIHDAVAAANILSRPLKAGNVSVPDLARVQRRRELPTRIIQGIVNTMQEGILRQALDSDKPFAVPGLVRWPVVGGLVARMMGFGILPEHVKEGLRSAPSVL